jgi:C4-dicarboxylate transporter, DctQ subunit
MSIPVPRSTLDSGLTVIDRVVHFIEFVGIVTMTLGALFLGVLQVVLRYVFNTGIHSIEAFFVLATVTAMLFAGSKAVGDDKHVRVDLITAHVSRPVRAVLNILAHFFALALCGYYLYCGLLYVGFLQTIEAVSIETGLPDWMIFMLVPVSMGMFAIRYVIRIIRAFRDEDIGLDHDSKAVVRRAESMS